MIFLFGLFVKPNSPDEGHSSVTHKKKQANICKFVWKIGTWSWERCTISKHSICQHILCSSTTNRQLSCWNSNALEINSVWNSIQFMSPGESGCLLTACCSNPGGKFTSKRAFIRWCGDVPVKRWHCCCYWMLYVLLVHFLPCKHPVQTSSLAQDYIRLFSELLWLMQWSSFCMSDQTVMIINL